VELLDIGAEDAVDSTEDTEVMVSDMEVTDTEDSVTDSVDVVTDSVDVVTDLEDVDMDTDLEDMDLDTDLEDVDMDTDLEDVDSVLATILIMPVLFHVSTNATLPGDAEDSCILDTETATSLISTDLISLGITTTLSTPFHLNDVKSLATK